MKTNLNRRTRFNISRCGRLATLVPFRVGNLWFAVLLAGQIMVSSQEVRVSTPPPLAQSVRAELGTIGVITSGGAPKFSFQESNGSAGYASEAAGEAVHQMFEIAAEQLGTPFGGPLLSASTIALTPVAAVIGAVKERGRRVAPAELAKSEHELVLAMGQTDVTSTLRSQFMNVTREKVYSPFVVREVAPEVARELLDHRSMTNPGIDTALELIVETVRLQRASRSEFSCALFMDARARLIRVPDRVVLYDQPFQFRSGSALFIDWTHNHGEPMRNVTRTGCRYLAEKMVEQLFLQRSEATPVAKPAFATKRGRGVSGFRRGTGLADITSPPISPRLLANLGRIGIISTSTLPNLALQRPLTKRQAAQEIGKNFFCLGGDEERMKSLVAGTCGFAIPLLVASGTVGRTAGAGSGVSEDQFRSADAALHRTVGELNLQETLCRELLGQAKKATPHAIEIVKKPFPSGEEKRFSQMACVMAGTLAWMPDGQTPAYYLTSQGIDTALEIQLLHPALNGNGSVNPPMALNAEVRARLFRVREGEELYRLAMKYRGRERKFTEWAANDAQPLKDEINHCAQIVAATLIDRLSLRALPRELPIELADALGGRSADRSTPSVSSSTTTPAQGQ